MEPQLQPGLLCHRRLRGLRWQLPACQQLLTQLQQHVLSVALIAGWVSCVPTSAVMASADWAQLLLGYRSRDYTPRQLGLGCRSQLLPCPRLLMRLRRRVLSASAAGMCLFCVPTSAVTAPADSAAGQHKSSRYTNG